ncbi:uncharacterized protein LOC142357142 [Convolutriloba macropyga]|uniref:uncharacterized protein LOC142357142 n=1 Tax=Convolutriloba macropyga TaxID=536237 RepID=UPI003F524505
MELPYSGTSDVYKLAMDSNVGSPGFWVYELVQDDSSGGTILRDYSPPDSANYTANTTYNDQDNETIVEVVESTNSPQPQSSSPGSNSGMASTPRQTASPPLQGSEGSSNQPRVPKSTTSAVAVNKPTVPAFGVSIALQMMMMTVLFSIKAEA